MALLSSAFTYYIALVNTAIMTPIAAEVDMERCPSLHRPSRHHPTLHRPSCHRSRFGSLVATVVKPRFRGSTEMAFVFNAEHPCAVLFSRHKASSVMRFDRVAGNFCTIAHVQTDVHAASLLRDPTEVRRCDKTEPVTEAAAKPKRRSIWKRTKRFVRCLIYCA